MIMNQDLPQVKTVKLLFVDVDEQQQAMFKMAFKMHNTTNYQVLDKQSGKTPELVIVDGDKPNSLAQWHKAKTDYRNSVVAFFSKSTPPITAPYLSKPIKFDTLFVNMRNLLQGNGVWMAEKQATNLQAASIVKKAEPTPIVSPQPVSRNNEMVIPRFDPNVGLLGAFRKAMEQQKDIVLLMDEKPILAIFPTIQRVWLAVESAQLQHLCRQENADIKAKLVASDSHLQERANASMTSVLWQMAFWTANGRLVQPLNANTVFKLKTWPNLTRLEPLPEAMRLSAFLTRTAVSLNMLYKMMPLDMADILNYIAATYLTDYLGIVQQVQESRAPSSGREAVNTVSIAPKPAQTQPADSAQRKSSGGLLSRLMKKLLNKK